jgi:hypothetical protein
MSSHGFAARRLAASVLFLAVAASSLAAVRGAEPSSHFLPDETMAVMRMPSLAKFGETLRERTKLGRVMFAEERIARFKELIEQEGDEELKDFRERLERYELKPEDAVGLLEGEIGVAITATPRGEFEPVMMALIWAEPAPELSDRLYAAFEKFIEESQEEESPIRRVDVNLAGHQVMQLRAPVNEREAIEMDMEFPDFNDEAAVNAYMEKRQRLEAEAKVIQVDQVNYFITRRENRILVGITLPNSQRRLPQEEGAVPDFDDISSVEAAAETFGKFLALHDGTATGLVPRTLDMSEIASALPEGEVWMEMFFDTSAAMNLLATAPNANLGQGIEKLGLKGIGPVAYRATLDGNVLRATVVASAPEPRTGLLTLLNQDALVSEPADWVPASVQGYAHFSFDLPKLYDYIKQAALEAGGDPAKQQFDTIERQCNGLFQSDVSSLLGSLGKRHVVISMLPELTAAKAGSDEEMATPPSLVNRSAFVWQISDEDLWKRIIKLGGSFAGQTQGAVTAVEEQGFTGLRLETPTAEGGVFVGRGYLTIGVGPGVVESVLASLRSPPALSESLRGGETMKRASQLMPLEPGIMFQVNDNVRLLALQRQAILQALDAPFTTGPLAELDTEEVREGRAVIEKIKELMPSEEELEDILGVGVGHAAVNDEGLILRSATEMPAP